jgi:hypothetical protein
MYPEKKIFFILLYLLVSMGAHAQLFGGNPPSIKWKQVNTPASRVIFPPGLDSTAERVANIISYLDKTTRNTIGNRTKKINLVLQNQTTISNAYVALGPYRSEFFLTHLQNSFVLGSLPWPDQLAIHEFRHVQQYNNFNVGLSKFFHILFGQEGQALANNAAIPNWFFEGDAVFNETNVSYQGRGRLPFFFKAYRSLWQANKKYSWMKLRNGSYKDFIPDDYALGYLLVAFGREKYGDEFWKNVAHDAASYKGLFYPFQQAIKKYSGENFVSFRNNALNYFSNYLTEGSPGKITHQLNHSHFKNEEYPALTNDNSIVLVKSSYKHIPAFIIRKGNEEKKIRAKDISPDNHFSFTNGKIVYATYRPDIRWGYRDYSDLNILNTLTGKQYMLTKHSKYFSPDINADGSKVIAVQVSPDGRTALHLLDATNGTIIFSVPNPHNLFYTYPKFYEADKIISAVRDTSGQMCLAITSLTDGTTDYLTPFSYNVIGFPCLLHDTIYFSASHGNDDRLFAYIIPNKQLYTTETGREEGVGYYQPSANNNYIAWSTYTADGFRLQQMKTADITWKSIKPEYLQENSSNFGSTAINKTNAKLLYAAPHENLPVTKYSKATRIVNFHSLEPTADDPDYTLTLISENILNTLQSQVSFTYNRTEEYKKIGFSTIYGALFPYLSAGVDYTIDRRGRYHGKRVYWNELEPRAGINVPLNFSRGRSLIFLNFGTDFIYNRSNFKGVYKDTIGNNSYSYTSNFLSFTHQLQKARQNIFPRFAQTLSLSYKRALTHYESSQFVANGNLYLPGFFSNHNLVLNGAYLRKDTVGQLNFSNGFPFSRGYTAENLHEMIKWGVNYHLPLLYPDAGFANIVYLLRVRSNLFYDHTHVNDFFSNAAPFKANFRSTGAEIFFDTKWWNEEEVSFGVRYSYLLDDDIFGGIAKNRWELILPVNLLKQ